MGGSKVVEGGGNSFLISPWKRGSSRQFGAAILGQKISLGLPPHSINEQTSTYSYREGAGEDTGLDSTTTSVRLPDSNGRPKPRVQNDHTETRDLPSQHVVAHFDFAATHCTLLRPPITGAGGVRCLPNLTINHSQPVLHHISQTCPLPQKSSSIVVLFRF